MVAPNYGEDGCPNKVPEGEYIVEYVSHEIRDYYGKSKLYYYFKIVASDNSPQEVGKVVVQYYNFKSYNQGRVAVGFHSNLFRNICLVSDSNSAIRMDRIPVKAFQGKLLRAKIVTVKVGRENMPLVDAVQYSKVSQILEVVDQETVQDMAIPF